MNKFKGKEQALWEAPEREEGCLVLRADGAEKPHELSELIASPTQVEQMESAHVRPWNHRLTPGSRLCITSPPTDTRVCVDRPQH